jgi:RNA polymerase sigma factor (sigma-70 family)
MAKPPLTTVLRHVRGLFGSAVADSSDRQLLERFVAHRDEEAFAALLRRHGPLVLGVCRQVLGDLHSAEDAFQATFLVLARKASAIRRGESLGPWLYRVAVNIARTARASAAQRRAHERQASAMAEARSPDDTRWRDWQPLLHEAVDQLPEKYRVPVVLCYLEGKTHEEAAGELAWPLGTVKGRLARARDLLRGRLERRGLALPAGGVALLLAQSTVQAAIPAALADATRKAAVLFAAQPAAPTTASATAVLLAKGALKTLALQKLVLAAFFVSLAAALAGGSALLAHRPEPEALPGELHASAAGLQPAHVPVPQRKEPNQSTPQRIVFVGDSSTDGNTYLLLIRQALAQAGRPVPGCINAGVSTDTMRGIRQRLERDVFGHRPTLVAVSAGTHDAIQKVAPAEFKADVRAIAAGLQTRGIPLLLLTTGLLGGEYTRAEPRLAEYNAILHRLAGEFGCPVADVNRRMLQARAAGVVVVEADNVHPSYEGNRLIARAVLDALGHADVPVPKELSVSPMPGIVKEWRIRIAPAGQPCLDEQLVPGLEPQSAGWTTYTLPEEGPARTWWLEHERKRGFALSLDILLSAPKGYQGMYQGVSSLQADRSKSAYLHTGGHLQGVWLNGRRVYRSTGWTGWHAGKERVPVRLRAGRNIIVIETGADFFLSLTDQAETPQERLQPPAQRQSQPD